METLYKKDFASESWLYTKGFINTKGVKTVMKEFLIVIVLVFHFYAACEFSTHFQRLE